MDQTKTLPKHNRIVHFSLERIICMCCCYFLCAAILLSLDKLLPVEPALAWAALLFPVLILPPIALGKRRFFLLLAVGLLVFLFLSYDYLPQWQATLTQFMAWHEAGFLPRNEAFTYWYYLLLRFLLAVAVCGGLWLLLRLRVPTWLLLLGALGLLIGLTANGLRGHSIALYLLAAGGLPLLAGSSVARDPMARGRATALALPLTSLILIVVMLTLPADTAFLRWPALDEKATEVKQQLKDLYRTWQVRDQTLAAFDLSPQYHAHLGGPIAPDNTRMLLVETTTPFFLKSSVYDHYTGHSWERHSIFPETWHTSPYFDPLKVSAYATLYQPVSGSDADVEATPQVVELVLNYDSLTMSPEEALYQRVLYAEHDLEAINRAMGLILDPDSDYPLADFARQVDVGITLLHPQETRLFYYGKLTDFSSEDMITPYVEENSELKAGLALDLRYRYDFSSLLLDRTQAGFTKALLATVEQYRQEDEMVPFYHPMEAAINCLQLPPDMRYQDGYAEFRQLAADIVGAGLDPDEQRSAYEQGILLERWLQENCEYTLTPEAPPADRDFVLHFLDTREGYCVYYASTMVMMARSLGIPARYITGYTLHPTRRPNQYEATNATAHAWAELFIEGIGWLTFDPTGQTDFTEAELDLLVGGELRDREFYDFTGDADAEAAFFGLGRCLAVLAVTACLLLAVSLFLLRLRRALAAYQLPQLLARFSPKAALELYYRDLLRQHNLLGWQQHPGETILAYLRRLGVYLPEQAEQLQVLGQSVCALRYGDQEPTQADLKQAATLHAHFEARLRQKLKRAKYYGYRLKAAPKS